METNQEILKAKIIQLKVDLETKLNSYSSSDLSTKIELTYGCSIKKIYFNDEMLNPTLINEINLAIYDVKAKLAQEYSSALASIGIKI
jgi:hypothetical protein